MFTENQLLPISALQHLLYCPRQCALIHLEQQWAENRFTAEGQVVHKRAHDAPDESRPGIRITRSLPVSSLKHGITGQCDIVEFHYKNHESQITNHKSTPRVVPVEYKRGKPKSHAADEVQLCAQTLCLEEMLNTHIPTAHLFYNKRKHRTKIPIDQQLRDLTAKTCQKLHALINNRITPTATYNPDKCDACSLIEICQPKTLRLKRGTAAWFQSQISNL